MEDDREFKFLLNKIKMNRNIDFGQYRPQVLKRRIQRRLQLAGCATYKDEKDEKLASKLGADKYILKPAEPDELLKIIKGVIRDVEEGKFEPKKPALAEEKEVLKLYSERLVNKLEKKMLDLEKEITERKKWRDSID